MSVPEGATPPRYGRSFQRRKWCDRGDLAAPCRGFAESHENRPRRQKSSGRDVRVPFDQFGRVVGAGDRDVAIPVARSARVFLREGGTLPALGAGLHINRAVSWRFLPTSSGTGFRSVSVTARDGLLSPATIPSRARNASPAGPPGLSWTGQGAS